LARTLKNSAGVHYQLGQFREAQKSAGAARELHEQLVRDYPDVPEHAAELARTHGILALTHKRLKQPKQALESFQAARPVWERLVRDRPNESQYSLELGGHYVDSANLVRDTGEWDAALIWYRKAIDTLEPLSRARPPLALARLFLRNSYWGRAEALNNLRRYAETLPDYDRAIALDDRRDPKLRLAQAEALAHLGTHVRATSVAEELAAQTGASTNLIYDAACVFALSVPAAAKDAGLTPAERTKLAEQYATRAVSLLRQAMRAGYKDVEHMKKNADLDPLRSRDDFQKLIAEMAGQAED
jgi:tetratricopeptide (TPR) repeat protein